MRRGLWIVALLVVILGGIAIGVGAYNAGVSHGLAQTGHAVEVVRDPGWGFFPFGLFLFPLFFFLIFGIARAAFWGRRWSGPGHEGWGPKGRSSEGRAMFEDWHRRQHEGSSAPAAGPSGGQGPPTGV